MKLFWKFGILLVLIFNYSCQTQTINLTWIEFSSAETGIKVNVPCQPDKNIKVFQEEPKPIRVFTFDCKVKDGIKYLFDLKEYMDDFDENKISERLKYFEENFTNEIMLKTANLKKEDIKSVIGKDTVRIGF